LSGFQLLVVFELVPAKHLHYFTLPAGLLEVFTAGVSIGLSLNPLFFQDMLTRDQNRPAKKIKLQLRRADCKFVLEAPPSLDIFHLRA
jgi:hypothetical protein